MISPVAGIITLLNSQFSSPQMVGISPPPLPSNAGDPYVTVQEIMDLETESMEGQSGLLKSVIQVNVWSNSYETAHALRKAIRDYLLSFSGPIGGSPPDATLDAVNHIGGFELNKGLVERHQLISRFKTWWQS
jgi:hypothetical protein